MKRVILVILAAAVVFVGILLVLPSFIDWGKYRGDIVQQMGNATGHRYEIAGDLNLAILPFPHVVVEKLSVFPADGKEPLASIERADVSVALMPLISGKVEVTSIVLVKPDVRLAVAADGTPSWMTPVLQEKLAKKNEGAGSAQLANSIALNDIRIKGGAFSYDDHRAGKLWSVKDVDVSLHADTLFGPFSAEGFLVYNGLDVKMNLRTGKIGEDKDSVALQADIKVPASSTTVSWSGVVAFKDKFEIQGEMALDTANAGSLALLSGGQALAGYEKPLSLRGILTASPQDMAFRNMKLTYAGISGGGSVVVTNLTGGAIPVVTAELAMEGAVDVAALLPPSSGKQEKRFLPESITLPKEIGAKISLSAPSVVYAGTTISNFRTGISYSGKTIDGEASGAMAGGGDGTVSGRLSFASMSKSAQSGAVTLSDPALIYNVDFKADKIEKALEGRVAFAPLTGKFSVKSNGKVSAKSVAVDDASIMLGAVPFNASGSWSAGARDKAKLSVSSSNINLDDFMPPADPAKKTNIQDTVQKLALPFDLDLTWALEQAKLMGRDYNRLAGHAVLTGKKLQIAALEVKDAQGSTFTASGAVGDITALKDIDITVHGSTADAPALIAEFTGKPAALPQGVKAGEVVAELKGQRDKLAFAANLKAMDGALDVSGAVADVLKAPVVSDLTLRLKHPNYVDLARVFSPEFKGSVGIRKTLDIFASMKRSGAVYALSELQADVGPSQFTGSVTVDLSGAKPSVTAKIQAGDMPLDELLGHDVRQKASVRAQPVRQEQQAQSGGGKWSRETINTEWMHKINLSLTGSARSFSYGPWAFANAGFDISLHDGALKINQLDGDMYGGQAVLSGKAVSPAPASPLAVDAKVTLQGVSLESFVQAFSGSQLVRAKGDVSLNAEIDTAGASPAMLISGLGGKGDAKGSGLVFEGFDLARMSRTLAQPPGSLKEGFSSILDASMSGGSTRFDMLSLAFTINNGIVNFNELALTGPDATVNSLGAVNLPLWTIDMESTITLTEPKDAPPLKAVFKGPLDNPGQTFAKGALDNYVRSLIGKQVQDAIVNKLEKKGALKGEKGELLQGLIGGLTGQPVPQQPPVEQQPVEQQAPIPQQPEPQTVQQQQPKEITPEDVFKGVLQGVLKGQ